MEDKQKSYFDGGLLQLIGWTLLGFLITVCTLGICYPWTFCMIYSWEAKHTVINGKRLKFNGKAIGLFGTWIKWVLLTIITLGIYAFWIPISLKKWQTKHTEFEGGVESNLLEKDTTENSSYAGNKKQFAKPIDIPDENPKTDINTMVKIDKLNIYVSNTQVTQNLYESVVGKNPSHFKGEYKPVEFISWYEAIEFCNKLSEKEGFEKAYVIDEGKVRWNENSKGYRLLTGSEWVALAKAGSAYKYAGSNNINEVGWYDNNSFGRTHNVATKLSNDFGLYDMTGNVFEWVWDTHGDSYRLAYGGSWGDVDKHCDIYSPCDCHPDSYYVSVGMRVARSI